MQFKIKFKLPLNSRVSDPWIKEVSRRLREHYNVDEYHQITFESWDLSGMVSVSFRDRPYRELQCSSGVVINTGPFFQENTIIVMTFERDNMEYTEILYNTMLDAAVEMFGDAVTIGV